MVKSSWSMQINTTNGPNVSNAASTLVRSAEARRRRSCANQ
jgi:hypothetical protein